MRKHILLIDDDKDELEILMVALEQCPVPVKCTWAQGADHALAMLEYLEPDCILIDINMPKTDGLQCLQQIKAIKKLEPIPVVIYSTHVDGDTKKKAADCGAFKCIKKPTHIGSLSLLIEELLESLEWKSLSNNQPHK
jgi:DNA-binding NtrC family response regulator